MITYTYPLEPSVTLAEEQIQDQPPGIFSFCWEDLTPGLPKSNFLQDFRHAVFLPKQQRRAFSFLLGG